MTSLISPNSTFTRLAVAAAVAVSFAFAVLLSAREVVSPDVGYLLAYGEHFWDKGVILDTDPLDYSVAPSYPESNRPEVGPRAWYDSQGRYRHVNTNWLTAVVFCGVYRQTAILGLSILRVLLVAAVMGVMLVLSRRFRLGWLGAAGAVLLTAMVSYERFLPRPELFSLLILPMQLCILARRDEDASPLTWKSMVALVALQILLVNFHSYFVLGVALTAAMLADRLGVFICNIIRGRGATPTLKSATARLALVLLLQIAACFANPWTWRLVYTPFQMIAYLGHQSITQPGSEHPWATIAEMLNPFSAARFTSAKWTYAFYALLGLAGAGTLASLCLKRWAWAMWIAGSLASGLSIQRNVPFAAVLALPISLAAISQCLGRLAGRFPRLRLPVLEPAAACLLCAAGIVGVCTVPSSAFYTSERSPLRFGLDISRLRTPLNAADWINRNKPQGRIWTDFNSSSNLYFFIRPHQPLNIHTNTLVVDIMRETVEACTGKLPFETMVARYDPQTVVLETTGTSAPLTRSLSADANWAVTYVGGTHVIFVRRNGPNAQLVSRTELKPASFNLPAYMNMLRASDPVASSAYSAGGATLFTLGWTAQAVELFRKAVELAPADVELWNRLGLCLARRGQERLLDMMEHQKAGRTREMYHANIQGNNDWMEARKCFEKCLELNPRYIEAAINLANINGQISSLQNGVVVQMKYEM